ncbi:MAG TPA: AbrB/MazE/SpoVT family DNA-binding domain-containing protein [Patescibacteria group bacterium]|nr:AbrB/MazE/SpoVT family DNA-binding domain-containing protein [Patescibacteria group bacterium]
MLYTATVTQKGQVTIPATIRKMLGVKPYGKVAFKKLDHLIVLTPATHFLTLKGSIKTKASYTDDTADKAMLEAVKKEYEKTG